MIHCVYTFYRDLHCVYTFDISQMGLTLGMEGSLGGHEGTEVAHVVDMCVDHLLQALADLLQLGVVLGLSLSQCHLRLHVWTDHMTDHMTVTPK